MSVREPAAPVDVNTVSTPGEALAVAVAGDYAYIADGESQGNEEGNLRVIHIASPQAAHEAGQALTPGRASGVVVAGQYAYLADGREGLFVIDVSDPARPEPVGAIGAEAFPGTILNLAIHRNHVYLAAERAGLHLISVAEPTLPEYLPPSLSIPGTTTHVHVAPIAQVALVAARDGGLFAVRLAGVRVYLPVVVRH